MYYTDRPSSNCDNCEFRLEMLNGECSQEVSEHWYNESLKPLCQVPIQRATLHMIPKDMLEGMFTEFDYPESDGEDDNIDVIEEAYRECAKWGNDILRFTGEEMYDLIGFSGEYIAEIIANSDVPEKFRFAYYNDYGFDGVFVLGEEVPQIVDYIHRMHRDVEETILEKLNEHLYKHALSSK